MRLILLILLFTGSIYAQSWRNVGSSDGACQSMGVYKDQLYSFGGFHFSNGAYLYVARWNGICWDSLGRGVNANIHAFAEYDSILYVGGDFNCAGGDVGGNVYNCVIPNTLHVARWDSVSWYPAGGNESFDGFFYQVNALAVYKGELYAGGNFTRIGGINANRIARWDGVSWKTVGGGVNNGTSVTSLCVYNNELYVGGDFFSVGSGAGTVANDYIARWNGTNWNKVGTYGLNAFPEAMTVDTLANILYVGGGFTYADNINANTVARWNGSQWDSMSVGFNSNVMALKMYHGELYAGGIFSLSGNDSILGLAKWNGAQWVEVGGGLWAHLGNGVEGRAIALQEYHDTLYVGGGFNYVGVGANMLAAKNIAAWYSPGITANKKNDRKSNEVFLGDAQPNPFSNSTVIPYDTPLNTTGEIIIYNTNGLALKTYKLQTGKHNLSVDLRDVASGVYSYSLQINGQQVQTKRMVFVK